MMMHDNTMMMMLDGIVPTCCRLVSNAANYLDMSCRVSPASVLCWYSQDLWWTKLITFVGILCARKDCVSQEKFWKPHVINRPSQFRRDYGSIGNTVILCNVKAVYSHVSHVITRTSQPPPLTTFIILTTTSALWSQLSIIASRASMFHMLLCELHTAITTTTALMPSCSYTDEHVMPFDRWWHMPIRLVGSRQTSTTICPHDKTSTCPWCFSWVFRRNVRVVSLSLEYSGLYRLNCRAFSVFWGHFQAYRVILWVPVYFIWGIFEFIQ